MKLEHMGTGNDFLDNPELSVAFLSCKNKV